MGTLYTVAEKLLSGRKPTTIILLYIYRCAASAVKSGPTLGVTAKAVISSSTSYVLQNEVSKKEIEIESVLSQTYYNKYNQINGEVFVVIV